MKLIFTSDTARYKKGDIIEGEWYDNGLLRGWKIYRDNEFLIFPFPLYPVITLEEYRSNQLNNLLNKKII